MQSRRYAGLYMRYIPFLPYTILIAVFAIINYVGITEKESTNFTCNFSKRDFDNITVYWTVDGGQYDCDTAEEDIEADSNGCYTTETQSVLLIRNTGFITGNHNVQCILQQNIPQEFRDDDSFKEEYNDTITGSAARPASGSVLIVFSNIGLEYMYNIIMI